MQSLARPSLFPSLYASSPFIIFRSAFSEVELSSINYASSTNGNSLPDYINLDNYSIHHNFLHQFHNLQRLSSEQDTSVIKPFLPQCSTIRLQKLTTVKNTKLKKISLHACKGTLHRCNHAPLSKPNMSFFQH